MKENRDYILYLEDIVVSMLRILEYAAGLDFESFKKDQKTFDAIVRNFEIIGEAVKNVPKDIKEKYTSIPWEQMYRLRNRVIHDYFGVEHEIIWRIISDYLPENLREVEAVLKNQV